MTTGGLLFSLAWMFSGSKRAALPYQGQLCLELDVSLAFVVRLLTGTWLTRIQRREHFLFFLLHCLDYPRSGEGRTSCLPLHILFLRLHGISFMCCSSCGPLYDNETGWKKYT